MNRLAPGWHEGKGGVMQPLKAGTSAAAATNHGEEHDLLLEEETGGGGGGVLRGHDNNNIEHPNAEPPHQATPSPNTAASATPTPDLFKDFVEGLERLDSTLGSSGSARPRDVDDLI